MFDCRVYFMSTYASTYLRAAIEWMQKSPSKLVVTVGGGESVTANKWTMPIFTRIAAIHSGCEKLCKMFAMIAVKES